MTSSSIQSEMSFIEVLPDDKSNSLSLCKATIPTIKDHEILVEVHVAGVNRPDILQRKGHYAPPKGVSPILGLEVAGKIVNIGKDVFHHKVGDFITALAPGGGYAEYCAIPASHALPIPKGFDLLHAAAIPETFFTVWHNLIERGKLQKNDYCLIHGGASGIGTAAIQLAKWQGAKIITTVGSDKKVAFCKQLGADHTINYKNQDFVTEVKNCTNRHGADVILDMVGGCYVEKNYICAAIEGRIVQIAVLAGAHGNANIARLMAKRLIHTGSTLRPQSDEVKTAIADNLYQHLWPEFERGTMKPIIDRVFPLKDAEKAHDYMETSQHMGKIMLTTPFFQTSK